MRGRLWPLVAGIAVIAAFLLAFSGRFLARKAEHIEPPPATIAFHAPEALADVIANLIESFTREFPHIDVRYEPLPDDINERRQELERTVDNAAATTVSSNTADGASGIGDAIAGYVYAVDLPSVARWREQGWAMSLGQFDADRLADEFVRSAFEQTSFPDDTYGLPWMLEPGLLYYRRDLIEGAGLDPPQTWSELVAVSQRVIDQGLVEHGFVWAGTPSESLTGLFMELLRSNGETLVDDGDVTLDRPAAREALQFLRDTVEEHGISPADVTGRDDGGSRELFVAGDALFLRYPGVLWRTGQEKQLASDRWGVAPIPAGPRGEGSHVSLNGLALVVGSRTTADDPAWEFIRWMTADTAQTMLGKEHGRLPARASPYQTPAVPETQPFFTTIYGIMTNNAFPLPPFPMWVEISKTVQENVHAALTGELTVDEALNGMTADVERLVPPEARRDQRDTRIGVEGRQTDH